MKAPDKIYIEQKAVMYNRVFTEPCKHDDYEYIYKDTLMEWMKEKKEQMKIEAGGCSNMLAAGKLLAFEEVIKKLESL